MRSRVTAKLCPTSSSVCSLPSPTPKRILMTFSSRGVSVLRTDSVCSLRFRLITASAGETTWRSYEVAKMRIFLFADWRLQRDWLLRDLEDLADLRYRNVHALGDLFRGRFASKLLHQRPRRANQF